MSHKSKLNQINTLVSQIRTKVTPLHPVENAEGRWGFATPDGKVAIPHQWRIAGNFYEGFAKVADDSGKCGFIDKTGKLVIPCKFGCSGHFSSGLCWVKGENGKFGFIDRTGALIIPCRWKAVTPFYYHSAAVMDDNDLWHVIDPDETIFSKIGWKLLIPLRNGYFLGKNDADNWKLVNEFGGATDLVEDNKDCTLLLPTRDKNGKWGFAETKIVFTADRNEADKSAEYQLQSEDGGYVIRRNDIKVVSKPAIAGQWKIARCFCEGLARVMDDTDRWGYVDESGQLVIPCRWIDAGPFWGGTAEVEDVDLGEVTIDHSGKII